MTDMEVSVTRQGEAGSMMGDMLIRSWARKRRPDLVIGDPTDPYLLRWWIQKDPERGSVYLHQVLKDDDDRALHDHPWDSASLVLQGVLREVMPNGSLLLCPGELNTRRATDAHRLEIVEGPVWTLFTTGPRVRDWGFHCANGWVPWQEFVKADNPGEIGRGCGE